MTPLLDAETSSPYPVSLRGRGISVSAVPALAGLAVAGTGALALGLTARSLAWPLVHDAPILHYVAARILQGAVPYRDLFDMNFPGTYLVHVLGLVLFGRGDAGFRAFDLAVVAVTAAGLVAALRSFGRWAAGSAAALFWLYHVSGGAWRAGQRDLILCALLAWTTAAAVAYRQDGRPRALGLAGLALGVGVWIKPHAVLLLPVLAAVGWRRGEPGRGLAALAAGITLPGAAVLGWLAAAGGLPAFLDMVGGYLLPLYAGLGRVTLVEAIRGHDLGPAVVAGLGLWALGGLAALWRTRAVDSRAALLGAGVVYGALHFALQGKGWEYHLYPAALFAVALGAAGLGAALAAGRRLAAVALVVVLVATAATLGVKGLRNLDPAWIAGKRARTDAVAAAVAPLTTAGGAVQVLDTTDGGIHALYLLDARQPTRFLYDFHFYHDVGHPYVRGLRAELLDGLRRRPPAALVLFERGWPRGDYGRLGEFPALAAWLEANYRLAREGDGYRVYAKTGDR